MKILFLCGSLEPGKDGVGDYTRRLAGELIRQGHDAAIVSLNDRHTQVEERIVQSSEEADISVLRIPSMFSAKKRFSLASEFINSFDPEWLSLQFVPYSFNVKGLPFGLAGKLKKIGKGRKWHIMFHELWVTRYYDINIKDKIISYIQQGLIIFLIKRIIPSLIHTHVPLYKMKLDSIGYNAASLPLFSNITVDSLINLDENKLDFVLAFFSQVRVYPAVIDYVNKLSLFLEKKGMGLSIILIGGNSNEIRSYIDQMTKLCPKVKEFASTGFLTEREVSTMLSKCDMGITPVPRHVLGKSGSVAAFLSHGKPVAAPRVKEDYVKSGIGFFDDEVKHAFLIEVNWDNLEKARRAAMDVRFKFEVKTVARQFIFDLSAK